MLEAQFYFLSDQYYLDFPDDKLMKNKEMMDGGFHKRPCFFTFHIDKNGHPIRIDNRVAADVIKHAKNVLAMAKHGSKVIFPDVFQRYSSLEQQLLTQAKM